jgi:hypothetical protein
MLKINISVERRSVEARCYKIKMLRINKRDQRNEKRRKR